MSAIYKFQFIGSIRVRINYSQSSSLNGAYKNEKLGIKNSNTYSAI